MIGKPQFRFHWQNLSIEGYRDSDNRRRERTTARGWRYGRCWLDWGDSEKYPRSGVDAEWHFGRQFNLFSVSLSVGEGDSADEIGTSITIWPVSFHLAHRYRLAKTLSHRLIGHTYRNDDQRSISLSVSTSDGGMGSLGTIRWRLWSTYWSWSSKTPKWRDGHWNPVDAALGRFNYSNVTLSTHDVLIPMPERTYPAKINLDESTWRRARFPFLKKSIRRANVDIPGGIGHPGKGENAWDCGDDGLFGMTAPARTVEEAIAKVAESVLESRMKYGGTHTFTPIESAAD